MPQSLMCYDYRTALIRCNYLKTSYGFWVRAVWLFGHHTVAKVFFTYQTMHRELKFIKASYDVFTQTASHSRRIGITSIVRWSYNFSTEYQSPHMYDRHTVAVRLSGYNCTMPVRVSHDEYYRALTARAL